MKAIIFCGGRGTRLWPVSRESYPKPFIPFVKGKSFFEITYQRLRKIFKPEEIFVSTEDIYIPFVRKQATDVPKNNIIAEPERKDLLAACGLATAIVDKYFPNETLLISWAKHLIARESLFLKAVLAAGSYADKTGLIVSVDSKPEFPSVHHGWVKLGKVIAKENGFKIMQIKKHIEKPDQKLAKKLFEEGDWLINTGYRIWNTKVMLSYYKKFHPAMYQGLVKIADAWGTKKQDEVLKREYHNFKKDSVEYGIFEKLEENARATIPVDMGWEDAGISWEVFYKSFITSKKKTVIEGGADVELMDSDRNFIYGRKGKIIALIGIKDLVVVDTPDALLVCSLDKTQKVKDLYNKLKRYKKEYVK